MTNYFTDDNTENWDRDCLQTANLILDALSEIANKFEANRHQIWRDGYVLRDKKIILNAEQVDRLVIEYIKQNADADDRDGGEFFWGEDLFYKFPDLRG